MISTQLFQSQLNEPRFAVTLNLLTSRINFYAWSFLEFSASPILKIPEFDLTWKGGFPFPSWPPFSNHRFLFHSQEFHLAAGQMLEPESPICQVPNVVSTGIMAGIPRLQQLYPGQEERDLRSNHPFCYSGRLPQHFPAACLVAKGIENIVEAQPRCTRPLRGVGADHHHSSRLPRRRE